MKTFSKFHPITIVLYFLALLPPAAFISNPIIHLSVISGGIAFSVLLNKTRFNDIVFYISTLCFITVTNPLFSHNGVTPLFFLNGNPVTLEAIIYGISISIMLIAVIIWCKCFGVVFGNEKLLYLFGKSIPKLALILSMAFRFIPLLIRREKQIRTLKKANEIDPCEGFKQKVKNSIDTYTLLISSSFENAIDTSLSMKARGYGMSRKRSSFSLFKFENKDGVMIAVSVIMFMFCILGIIFGDVTTEFYPRVEGIDFSPWSLVTYISYFVLAFIPFIIELKELLVWKFCESRI